MESVYWPFDGSTYGFSGRGNGLRKVREKVVGKREMRRKDRKISEDAALTLLNTGEYGVLSLITPEGEPYGIPLSYVCCGRSLYFHSARDGLKMDCFSVSNKASFVVVGKTMPVYAKNFTTYYESVMVDGVIEHVDGDEKRSALFALAEKYLPEHMDKVEESIANSWGRTAVYALRIDLVIGKAKRPV